VGIHFAYNRTNRSGTLILVLFCTDFGVNIQEALGNGSIIRAPTQPCCELSVCVGNGFRSIMTVQNGKYGSVIVLYIDGRSIFHTYAVTLHFGGSDLQSV
jgi:hypothetical protein